MKSCCLWNQIATKCYSSIPSLFFYLTLQPRPRQRAHVCTVSTPHWSVRMSKLRAHPKCQTGCVSGLAQKSQSQSWNLSSVHDCLSTPWFHPTPTSILQYFESILVFVKLNILIKHWSNSHFFYILLQCVYVTSSNHVQVQSVDHTIWWRQKRKCTSLVCRETDFR